MEVTELLKLMNAAGAWGFEIHLNTHRPAFDLPTDHINYNGMWDDEDLDGVDLSGEKDVCLLRWNTSTNGFCCIFANSIDEAMGKFVRDFDPRDMVPFKEEYRRTEKKSDKG